MSQTISDKMYDHMVTVSEFRTTCEDALRNLSASDLQVIITCMDVFRIEHADDVQNIPEFRNAFQFLLPYLKESMCYVQVCNRFGNFLKEKQEGLDK